MDLLREVLCVGERLRDRLGHRRRDLDPPLELVVDDLELESLEDLPLQGQRRLLQLLGEVRHPRQVHSDFLERRLFGTVAQFGEARLQLCLLRPQFGNPPADEFGFYIGFQRLDLLGNPAVDVAYVLDDAGPPT